MFLPIFYLLQLSGAILVSCDGSDLSFIDVLMREAVYFCCSAAVLEVNNPPTIHECLKVFDTLYHL